MKKYISLLFAVLMLAACAKIPASEASGVEADTPTEEQPGQDQPGDTPGEDQPGTPEEPEATLTILVTLPDIDPIDTKATLEAKTEGGFRVSWSAGDAILVGGERFTLVSANGQTGTFSGKQPGGTRFDIVYPADAYPSGEIRQAGNDNFSHLRYQASLTGVDSYSDIVFGYGWAAEHGGRFLQTGCLKLVLNLPASATDVSQVSFEGEGLPSLTLDVTNGALSNQSFTAYLPCGRLELNETKAVNIRVTSSNGNVFSNTFYPATQTLADSHVIQLVTAPEKWTRALAGKGSINDPYIVRDAEDFNNIRNLLTENTYTYFRMTADINLSDYTAWTPINPLNKAFGIMFDGQNHKISHFTCTSGSRASVFGVLHGEVKNLTIEDSQVVTTTDSPIGIVAAWNGNVNGTLQGRMENVHVIRGKVSSSVYTYIGGLSGRSGAGTFINCSFNGTVERSDALTYEDAYHPMGGILGGAEDGVTIQGCSTSGTMTVNSGRASGGILGYCATTLDITGCQSTMSISSRDDVVGGIVGYASGSITVTKCAFEGQINAYAGVAGGILGQGNASSGYGTRISRCFSSGTIKGTTAMGGILGRASNQGLTMEDCGTTMNINASDSYNGGMLADAPMNTTIRRCYASGEVIGKFALGGLIGRAFGLQKSSASLDTDVNTTVEDCIAFNPRVKTITSGGENPEGHYSGGAIIGCSSRPNTLKNCWRSASLTLDFYATASLNVLFDHADSSPEHPLTQPSGSAKWFSPYHGKSAASGTTLNTLAQSLGWSTSVWNFSGNILVPYFD